MPGNQGIALELLSGDDLCSRAVVGNDLRAFSGFCGGVGMNQKIQVLISPNEKKSSRATGLAKAIAEDIRFSLPEFQDIKTDLQFRIDEPDGSAPVAVCFDDRTGEEYSEPSAWISRIFNVELKEPADYVSSVLGTSGHAAMQYLDQANMFLVLGSDTDVSQAIKQSLQTRYRGSELAFQISSYEKRLQDFEANAWALGCPVARWKASPYPRVLSTAHKILTGGSLAGYGPRPKENEREVFAANCLFRGIGAETLAGVLQDYRVALVPRVAGARPVEELPGIGPKRAGLLNERIVMVYGAGL